MGVGGSETFALSIIPLISEHFDISLIITSGAGTLVPKAREMGINVIETQMKGKLNKERIKWGKRFFQEEKPSLVHIHSFDNHFMVRIAAILAKIPIIITHHHTMPGSRYTSKLARVESRLLPATDTSIFVGKKGCEELWSLVKDRVNESVRDRLFVMHDAFDLDAIKAGASEDKVEKIRQRYNITDDTPVIGVIARLHPVKNLEMLVKVLAGLKTRYPVLKCFIVGEGDEAYKQKIELLAEEFGVRSSLIFTGFQENVPAFLKIFDATVLTSHFEGLPRCIIESYAVGTPVVATDVGCISEVLTHEREGFLVEAASADHFINQLDALLSDKELRLKLGENARIKSEEFALRPFADRICTLYDRLLTSPPPAAKKAKAKYRFRYNLIGKP